MWDSSNLQRQVPVFISRRNRVAQLYTWFPFRRLLRLTGLRWKYSNLPPQSQSQSQSYITIDGQSACLSWCQKPIWEARPTFLLLSLIIFRQLRICWCEAPSPHKFKLYCDRRSVGQFALVSGPLWEPRPDFNFLSSISSFFLLHVEHPLWREDGSVICSAVQSKLDCPASTSLNFVIFSYRASSSVLRPTTAWSTKSAFLSLKRRVALLYPQAPGSLFFAFYDSCAPVEYSKSSLHGNVVAHRMFIF
jgi:hypothetical protein